MPDREKIVRDLDAFVRCGDDIPGLCDKNCPLYGQKGGCGDIALDSMRDAIALLKEQEPGWISVDDRLPENQDTVLIVKQLKSGIRQIGLGYCIKEHPRHDYQTGEDVVEPYWVCGGNNNIIYWQELPKIPERGGGK